MVRIGSNRMIAVLLLLAAAGCERSPVPPPPRTVEDGTTVSVPASPEPSPVAETPAVPEDPAQAEPPAPAEEPPAEPAETARPEEPDLETEIEEKDKGIFLLNGGGRIYYRDRMIALNGVSLLQRGPIELFACTEGGKGHERVVSLRLHPETLRVVLILLRLKNGPPPVKLGGSAGPQGDRVIVTIEWRGKEGTVIARRAEELIRRADRDETMPFVGWNFTGSQFLPELDPQTGQPVPGRSIFAATRYRSIITTWRDGTTILDNPLPEAEDDSLYVVNTDRIPPAGTKVRVVLRPPTEAERKEIADVEAKLAAAPPPALAPKGADSSPEAPAKGEGSPSGPPAPPEDPAKGDESPAGPPAPSDTEAPKE